MMSDDELVLFYRRIVLMSQLAKQAVFGDALLSQTVTEEELGMLRAVMEQADQDVAAVFAELRIYREMFAAKLEAWKHGRTQPVDEAPQPVSDEPVEPVGDSPEPVGADAGGSGVDGERPDRPDPAPDTKRPKKRKKVVD